MHSATERVTEPPTLFWAGLHATLSESAVPACKTWTSLSRGFAAIGYQYHV